MTYRSALALGSNLGDRLATLQAAVGAIGELGIVLAVSSLYETAPVGGPEQGPFLNAVVVVDTELEPAELLAAALRIEQEEGRVRQERWGPRTLDIDVITVLDSSGSPVVVSTSDLTVPHPRAAERRFVLEPLAEVWPQAPLGRTSAAHALTSVSDQEVERIGGEWVGPAGRVPRLFVTSQFALLAVFAVVAIVTREWPPSSLRALVGGAVAVVGGATMAWAAAALGPALTALPEPRPGTQLVATGPYRWVRHPIYLGLLATVAGVAVVIGSVPAGIVSLGLGALLWFKAGYEERRLRLRVPGYTAYMRSVRGRLLPRLRTSSHEP